MLNTNSSINTTANERWQLVMRLFRQLSSLPQEQRSKFLETHCPDTAMRQQLHRMMETLEQKDSILDKSVFIRIKHIPAWQPKDWIGKHIDQFLITRLLNEGGMGVVFKAQQEAPIKRDVAIKMIRNGAPHSFVDRFRFEQSTLAKLNHPNIATIHTVGMCEDESPFLVMEFIQGQNILDHCNTYCLSISARLQLFLNVCDAISFCHQRGIMHRDIKPSNVLIRRFETGDVPIVIDFGIAAQEYHQMNGEDSTAQSGFMGTPEYMSPEHLMDASEMDIRADVYSLGCLLFSLLVGKSSFDFDKFKSLHVEAQKEMIQSFRPAPPKRYALALPREEQESLAHFCGESVLEWIKQLDDELDWIFLKATAKKREQRYASVSEFANDIKRFFNYKPIQARPQNKRYLFKKFVQRNKTLSMSVITVLAVTLTFSITLAIQNQQIKTEYQRAEVQRLLAEDRQKHAEAQTVIAEQEHIIAEQITDLLIGAFSVNDPYQSKNDPQTAFEVLNEGLASLRSRPFSNPELRHKILIKLAEVYANLGHSVQAIEIAQEILNSQDSVNIATFVRAHLVTAEANELSGQYDKAISHANKVYEMAQTEQIDDAWTAQVTSKLSSYHAFNHDYTKALEFGRKAVAANRALHGETHIETAKALGGLGLALLELEQLSESEQVLTSALHIYQDLLHPEDLEISNTRLLLGIVKYKYGKAHEAIDMLEPAVTNLKDTLGDSHPDYIAALNNLSVVYAMTGQWANTLENMSHVVDYMQNEVGVGSKAYLMTKMNLGVPMMKLGHFDDARHNWLEVLTLAKTHTPDDNLILGEAHRWLATLSLYQGTFETGRRHATESVQRLKIAFAGHHTKTFNALLNLAVIESELQNYKQSESSAVEAITMSETLPVSGRWRLSLANAIQAFSLFKQTAQESHKKTFTQYFTELKEEGGTGSVYFERVERWLVGTTTI